MTQSIPHRTGVVPPLARLVMSTGSLEKLLPSNVEPWRKLAALLRAAFPPAPDRDYVSLCTTYHAHGVEESRDFTEHDPKLVKVVLALLSNLMNVNGQWDYLKQQPWFIDGQHLVAIDVNYYPDRQGQHGQPVFHKDTAGNNVFVNLLFDNPEPIPATEWFVDVGAPGVRRRVLQKSLLPARYLADLDAARLHLRTTLSADEPVSGGVTEGANTYVSWVDDLIWHATPTIFNRHTYTAAQALLLHDRTTPEQWSEPPYQVYDHDLRQFLSVAELLGSIAECPTTWLRQQLGQNYGPQDINHAAAGLLWKNFYAGQEGRARYKHDVEERAKTPWRLTGRAATASTTDPTAPGSSEIVETPAGLSTRRRVNSDPTTQIDVIMAQLVNAVTPRSFLRTWVRVIPRDSEEGRRAFPQR